MRLTLTQNIFACCLSLFGPGFGFWGAYLCRKARLGSIWGFVISCFSAYAGWFIAGLVALNLYPNYGLGDPPESIAVLFTIPGFITGILGLFFLNRVARSSTTQIESDGSSVHGNA